ncbi:hypothetical protein OV079_15015 [Nannocystis pusilla]|uniref:Uncharacterized protein n=1 Tax=Nannocystis pusilla TaxID=889268 RepID=A0A9X3IXT0_9BACT|nr:hypothetical protein [Nannocystis pusilla]MCY1006839.1 hypothetical protein [Nannocystis pusilla]
MRDGPKSYGPITPEGCTITASRPRPITSRSARSPAAFERSYAKWLGSSGTRGQRSSTSTPLVPSR